MEYRVLARKYRPATFDDLIGQEVLVRTLSNAIATGRLAHAFLLTGIRGIGKTTTARIIARALNCESGPTIHPCGVCANCTMIAEDRHVDVLEMDAASRTGVGDIRDLIETVHYAPTNARYKIYIIDEVHMLSNSAFNALLKTLEEPPPHVKFIFATTEARKIPVTILSRCQKFDLKRIELSMLADHLENIARKEGASLTPEAKALLAQSAEGSVRDGLSLLDQAIAQATAPDAPIDEHAIRTMLGLADKSQTITLLSLLLEGKAADALQALRALYTAGADPLLVLNDLLELTHFITRIKLLPAVAADVTYAEHERKSAAALAEKLSMPVLSRLWQLLLKGIGEVKLASSPITAAEMILVRAAYAAELPTPAEIIREVQEGRGVAFQAAPVPPAPVVAAPPPQKKTPEHVIALPAPPTINHQSLTTPKDFTALVQLLMEEREALMAGQLKQFASLVNYAPPMLALHMKQEVPRDFAAKLTAILKRLMGTEWNITLTREAGAPTLSEQEAAARKHAISAAANDPLVASLIAQFPGAEVVDVKEAIA